MSGQLRPGRGRVGQSGMHPAPLLQACTDLLALVLKFDHPAGTGRGAGQVWCSGWHVMVQVERNIAL